MRILVTGGRGMLAQAIAEVNTEHELVLLSKDEFDISDPVSTGRLIADDLGHIDAIINCAAYTAVDKAEDEFDAAYDANALGPGFLALACYHAGKPFVHISTDYVFDGLASEPYTEESIPNPQSAYGKTKLEGEQNVMSNHAGAYVLRTSWLFGPHGKCFPKSILDRLKSGQECRVVSDQIGCPTYTLELAKWCLGILEKRPDSGVYHAGGPTAMTWFDFASKLREEAGKELPAIHPIKTEDWPTPAPRPAYSVLDSSKLSEVLGAMAPIGSSIQDYVRRYSGN